MTRRCFEIGRVWMPLKEIPGIPLRTLQRWCLSGRFRARKKKNRWHIYLPDLLEFSRPKEEEL